MGCALTISPKQKQPYISEATWKLIEKREFLLNQGKMEAAKDLSKQIRNQAREDKTNVRSNRAFISAMNTNYLTNYN